MFIGKDLVPLSTHYYIYTSKGILKYDVSINIFIVDIALHLIFTLVLLARFFYAHHSDCFYGCLENEELRVNEITSVH